MHLPRNFTACALAGALACVARAESAPTASSPENQKSDEVITLSEFNVTAGNADSYMPSESTTGSRVNAKVKDLPYAVSTLTSEFLRDFSIFEATEELGYMSSVSGVDDGGNLNLRGFNGGTNNLRNGLASNGLIDTSSLDRIEVIKGPAAAIYGATSPSGSMVVTTKRPTTTPRQNLTLTTGSYSLSQAIASVSGPLGRSKPRLFYRVDTQYYHRLYEVPGISSATRSATATLLFRPDNNTAVTVDAGYLLRLNNSAGGLPFNYDSVARHYTGGYAFDVVHKTIANPNDQKPRWNAVFEGIVEHRFNSVFSGKLAASANHRPLVNYQSYGGSQYDRTLNRIVDGRTSISYAKDDFDYRNAAADLTATYPALGMKHRTLFTADYSFQNRRGFSTTSTSAFNAAHPGLATAQKQVDTTFSIIPYEPVSIAAKGGPNFNPLTYARDNYVLAVGSFLRHEATLWHDRLILAIGYRHDYIRADLREPGSRFQRKLHDLNDSMLLGLTYRITPGISWYVGRNESFSPLSITTSANPTASIPQTTRGVSYETGVKGELLGGRLGFTADVYDTRRKNEQVTEIDPATGVSYTTYIGNTKTRGAELDANYRLSEKFQALVSCAYTDARAVNQGRDTDAENRHTKGTPLNAFSSALRYQLSALSLTVGVRYTAKSPASNATDGGTFNATTGRFVSQNGARDIYVPASTIWTAGGTYRWRTHRFVRADHTLTVTAKNLTNRLYIVPGNNRTVGDRFGVYATYSLAH
jgi:iron complex outermembrane recepter protein